MIVERVVVSHLRSNCFIVGMESSNEGMVIDPGGDADDIIEQLKKVKFAIKLIYKTIVSPFYHSVFVYFHKIIQG